MKYMAKGAKVNKEMTIGEVICKYPRSAVVFIEHGFNCVGCPASQSESIEEGAQLTEEEVKDSINYLQKTRAKFSLKNEGAEKKDFVSIEYYCPLLEPVHPVKSAPQSEGGVSPEAKQFNWVKDKFILGEGGFMPGFEDNIVGMKDGDEKTFVVKFPENSPRKDLAGKEAEFKVKMISVQKMELPEINDEFAKQMGAFDTLVALKESVKTGITAEKTEQEKQRKRGEILEKIAVKAKFEMPEAMVEYEKERLLEDLKNRVKLIPDPKSTVVKRILLELEGKDKYKIFTN